MAEPDTNDIASRIAAIDSEDASAALVADLRTIGGGARLLAELAANNSLDVRAYVADHAADVLGTGAVAILLTLSRDRSADVRSIAMEELIALSPSDARRLGPSLRRLVSRGGYFDRIFAMWQLVRINDGEAIRLLEEVAAREPLSEHGAVAETAALLLHGRDGEVRARLLAHDHRKTKSIAMGLAVRADAADRDALQRGADSLPDDECRTWCASALAVARRHDAAAKSQRSEPAKG